MPSGENCITRKMVRQRAPTLRHKSAIGTMERKKILQMTPVIELNNLTKYYGQARGIVQGLLF